jgi:nucleoid DNA-binding protein
MPRQGDGTWSETCTMHDLIEHLSDVTGTPIATTAKLIKQLPNAILTIMDRGCEELELKGLGTFKVRVHPGAPDRYVPGLGKRVETEDSYQLLFRSEQRRLALKLKRGLLRKAARAARAARRER